MRQPKPFFRQSTQSWYLKINKPKSTGEKKAKAEFISLGGKGQPGKHPPAEVWDEYNKIMSGRLPVGNDQPVDNLVGAFLAWCEQECKFNRMKPATYRWYERFLKTFRDFVGPNLMVKDLTKKTVADWRDKCYTTDRNGKSLTAACRRGAVVSVKRCLNWAVNEAELIPANPVKKIAAEKPQSREVYIKPEQWPAILSAVDDSDPFKQVLLFLKETGCRPGEAAIADCRHVDRERKVIVLGVDEWKCGKKTGKKRTIYLNEDAFLIVERAFARVGQKGRLFLNRKLQPFSVGWIGKKFASLQEKLRKQFGDDEFELFAYVIRHTWITDKLKQGVDVCTVAKLAGTSAEMVQEVYCQIGLNEDHMHNAAARKVVAS